MKSFQEHIASHEDLEERVRRTGAIVAYGSKSRREGDEAVRAYKQGQQALQRGGPEVDLEDRVKRIEQSLDHMFEGLIKQRAQIGSGSGSAVIVSAGRKFRWGCVAIMSGCAGILSLNPILMSEYF